MERPTGIAAAAETAQRLLPITQRAVYATTGYVSTAIWRLGSNLAIDQFIWLQVCCYPYWHNCKVGWLTRTTGQFTDSLAGLTPCLTVRKLFAIRISRRQLQGLNGCSGWHIFISRAFTLAFPYWSSTYSSPLLQASLFLSCSTYPLAIGFLFYRALRLVLSIFSDEGLFAWSLLLFPSTVFCGDTLASLPAFTASIYGGHVCCSRFLLWDSRLALVMYCDRFTCLGISNASKSLSYHTVALHPQTIR